MDTFIRLTNEQEIGANSYWIGDEKNGIVLDAGMYPKQYGSAAIPNYKLLNSLAVDAAIVSHSHLDHIGTLPYLLEQHPKINTYLTEATMKLGEALLHNSVNVMTSQRLELGITEYPLFTHDDINIVMDQMRTVKYNKTFKVSDYPNCKLTFYDAGHLLGSACVLIETPNKKILYSGDIQLEDQTLIPKSSISDPKSIAALKNIDTLIVETTRGAVPRDPDYTREKEEAKLAQSIQRCLNLGGAVLIPVFAMGKTQEILMMLHNFFESGQLKKAPIKIGGLSTKMTRIFDELADSTPRNYPEFSLLDAHNIKGTPRHKRSRKREPLVAQAGNIYVMSSGMMSAKTLSNQLAETLLPNSKNGLFFVGYCDSETPGYAIQKTALKDSVSLGDGRPKVARLCQIDAFDFSGHCERESLKNWIIDLAPKQALLVHGDPDASAWFEKELKQALPDSTIITPEPSKPYSI